MSDEAKVLLGFFLAACICIVSVTWAAHWYQVTTTKAAMEAGYIQSTLPGEPGVYWVKQGEPTLAPELP